MQSEPPDNQSEVEPALQKIDPDNTPLEEVKASLRRALAESKAGQRIPIAQMLEKADPVI
jgi:hypothetical protein